MSQQRGKTLEAETAGKQAPLFTSDFVLACLITFAAFASFYLLLATLPLYIKNIGGNDSEVGLIIGVFSGASLLLRPFIGRASDMRGKRPFILVGTIILAASSGLYTLIRSVPLLLGLRVIHGTGWASFSTATNALVADIAPRSRRGEAMGYYGMFNNLAMAVGPALGIALVNGLSFDAMFMSAAAIAIVAVVLSLAVRAPLHCQGSSPSGREPGPHRIQCPVPCPWYWPPRC